MLYSVVYEFVVRHNIYLGVLLSHKRSHMSI